MTPTERERIEFDSNLASYKYVDDNLRDAFINGYRSGATSEHDKARNQAIQDCIDALRKSGWSEDDYNGKIIFNTLEQLKTKP